MISFLAFKGSSRVGFDLKESKQEISSLNENLFIIPAASYTADVICTPR